MKDGVQQVNDTGGAMLRIVEGVKGVSTYLGGITSAASLRDQAQRLTEVVSIFDLGIDPTLPLKRPLALGV